MCDFPCSRFRFLPSFLSEALDSQGRLCRSTLPIDHCFASLAEREVQLQLLFVTTRRLLRVISASLSP